MVDGLDKLREAFAGLSHEYAVIGGCACDLILSNDGIEFRNTRDVDMVVCISGEGEAFIRALRGMLNDGGYKVWHDKERNPHFFRFLNEDNPSYPWMIELFMKHSIAGDLITGHLAKIRLEEPIYSLSAILLDDDYFHLVENNLTMYQGVSVPIAEVLMLLKMKAYLNLKESREQGKEIASDDIRKHQNDVLRLLAVADKKSKLAVSDNVFSDVKLFLSDLNIDENHLRMMGVPGISGKEAKEIIRNMYVSENLPLS